MVTAARDAEKPLRTGIAAHPAQVRGTSGIGWRYSRAVVRGRVGHAPWDGTQPGLESPLTQTCHTCDSSPEKTLIGRYAETVQLGAFTIWLIRRSAATLHSM
jgi:hypothetical protein